MTRSMIHPLAAFWRRQSRTKKIGIGLLTLMIIGLIGLYLWIFTDLPSVDNVQAGMALPTTRILDRHGQLLYEVIDQNTGRNQPLPIEAIPAALVNATIATEDRNFYSTPGVDPEGVLRALWINVRGGEVRAGGSTITQQVARNLLLDPQQRAERTLRRKLREMALAVQLSARYTKPEILALYLNQTYYGNMAYGVQAAAQTYFGKDAARLNIAESALLAGLPQSPAVYDPLSNLSAARTRQRVVLDLMVQAGTLTQQAADEAFAQLLDFGDASFSTFTMRAPHFVQYVWAQIEKEYPEQVYAGGLTVTTTLDLDWQTAALDIARRQLAQLNTPVGNRPAHNVNGAAVVALDPHTGQILTLLGSTDYNNERGSGAVNMATSPRQPGSTLKPFTYALTFDPARPDAWSPSTMVLDISTPFVTRQLQSYTPANYGLAEHGPVSVREALASSYNIPAVVALAKVGIPRFVNLLGAAGISMLDEANKVDLSITLGGGDVNLLELTAAYAVFPNEGRPIQPSAILKVTNKDNATLFEWTPPPSADLILDRGVAYLITDILSDNDARLSSFGSHSALEIDRPAAAKTGTTTDFRDNWTVGYTPSLVVGVWTGNPDNSPMREVSGVTGAGPIWNQFIRTVLAGTPPENFVRPPNILSREICALSGLLPTPYCPQTRLDVFLPGTLPTEEDTMFRPFEIDRRTGLLATVETAVGDRVQRIYQVLPPEAQAWGLKHGIIPAPDQNAVAPPLDRFRLLTPDPYTVYQLSPLIPFNAQQIRLSAIAPTNTARIDYFLNDQLIGTATGDPFWVWWALIPGDYTLTAQVTLIDGTRVTSVPTPFSVTSYVLSEARPASGEIK